jgi:WD40 repeat protein
MSLDPTRELVATARDGRLCVCESTTLRVLREAQGYLAFAEWSPDGRYVLTRAVQPPDSGDAVLLDARTLMPVRRLPIGAGIFARAAWSPDGRLVAFASDERRLDVHDVEGRRVVTIPHEGRVLTALFSPDGTRLLMGGDGGVLRVFDTERWEELVAMPGHSAYVFSAQWAPDGRTLLTASGDGTVRIWRPDVATAR